MTFSGISVFIQQIVVGFILMAVVAIAMDHANDLVIRWTPAGHDAAYG